MTIRQVILERTEMMCRAPHPAGRKIKRFRNRVHGALLGVVPFRARPTRRVLDSEEDVRDDCIPAYCSQCKVYTEYEPVAPTQEHAA